MFDANKLWKERLGNTTKELGKYLRYIFNGHILIVLVFLIGAASFYYQQWVEKLDPDFPVALIMAVLLAFLLTYSPIYTLLKEADRVYLLPLETKLKPYFQKAVGFSFFVQIYGLLLGLAVFMPMYASVNNGNFKVFFFFLLVLCLVKVGNLLIRWRVQYFAETNVHMIDTLIRYCVNAVLLYLLFVNASFVFLLPFIAIYALLYSVYSKQTRTKGLKWESLIMQEEKRMMSFYRLANLFTDVPKLKDQVKRRKWLDWLISLLPFKHENMYMHLYVSTFIRGGDYLGLFIRLTVIGMLALYFITFGNGQLLFVLLFLYLTGFQLLPLWNHHQNKIWLRLYPVNEQTRETSFRKILVIVLIVQAFFFSLPLFLKGEWLIAFLSLFIGIVFSSFFVFVYSKNKLKGSM